MGSENVAKTTKSINETFFHSHQVAFASTYLLIISIFITDLLIIFQKCSFISFLCLVQKTKFLYSLRNLKTVFISNCMLLSQICLQCMVDP